MQLSLTFSALLAGVLLALDVSAVPVAQQPRSVTLPIKRMEARNADAHPLVLLQQHINRGSKRLALMSGREAPTDAMMSEALRKRVLAVEGPEGLERRRIGLYGAPKSDKRFNRTGVPKNQKRRNNKGKQTGAGAAAGAAGAASAAGAAGAAGAGGAAADASAIGGADSANGVEVANQPTTDNSLGLDIEGPDIGFLATVQMGTPPQNYLILMDSGSADLWVASEACQTVVNGAASGDCGNHQTLGSTSSSSFTASNTPFQVTYGTGAVAGAIIQDDISIAGLTLKAHTFGVATQETTDFSDDSVPFDGLMGLAQSTLSQQQTATPVEALASQGLISDAITSYKIPRALDNKNDGEITFGALDPTKFDAATLVELPNVNQQGFWEAAVDAATVDGNDAGLTGRTAILDTGTTVAVLPIPDAEAIHKLIAGSQEVASGQFTVPCDFPEQVAFTFGGTSFAIDNRDIALQPPDAAGNCASGISGGSFGTSDTEWLVGDTFLKNVYYSTDVGKNTLSLAKLV